MASAFDRLADLLSALEAEGVRYVLFGGRAVNLHGYRMKKDTLRPIDHADAADLKAKFALEDD